jgi:serine/threonine-protein kinase
MPIQLGPNVTIADRFRLNRQLGRGGMGSVWHATHLGLDTPCAVKFIEGENATLPEAQARFEREAKAAAQLRSPHVVQIFDHGVWQGTPYIAMELLDGEDLGKRLIRVGRLSPAEAVKIVSQVCRALTKAHSVGIVHRDLKPDNIFLVRDDDREIAKVLDFGIAKAKGSGIDGSNTKTGAMLGTPYYMSPEQAQGTKAVDHRSDLWSLAVIVFQALTGKLPFESEALGDLLVKIIVTPVPVPSQMAGGLPASFDGWWAKASQRDPGMRFQTAKELADSLSLVFGQSQGTDMMERPGPRAYESVVPPPPHMDPRMNTGGGRFGHTPPGAGTVALVQAPSPSPVRMPGNTPQPAGAGTPHPFQQTPPGLPTTGAPMSRTSPGGVPGPRKGVGIAIGGAVAGVVLLATVVLVVVMKGKGTQGAAPAAAAAVPVATETTPATATAPPTASLEPPAPSTPTTGTATTAPTDSVSATAAARTPPRVPTVVAPPPTATIPTRTGPASTGKKKPLDLGI